MNQSTLVVDHVTHLHPHRFELQHQPLRQWRLMLDHFHHEPPIQILLAQQIVQNFQHLQYDHVQLNAPIVLDVRISIIMKSSRFCSASTSAGVLMLSIA